MGVVTFYANQHIGNRFGIKGPLYGVNGHRGQDFNGWAAGTPIPSFVKGVVVSSVKQTGLGWVTVVVAPNGCWYSFCHGLQRGLGLGSTVNFETVVMLLGNTGTLSNGPHVHITKSPTGIDPASAYVVDPLPDILAARAALSGGGITPIPPGGRELNDCGYVITTAVDTKLNYVQGNTGKMEGVQSAGHLSLLTRFRDNVNDTYYKAELDIIAFYQARVAPTTTDTTAIASAVAAATVAAVNAALKDIDVTAEVDYAKVGAAAAVAVDAALKDDFAAIPKPPTTFHAE